VSPKEKLNSSDKLRTEKPSTLILNLSVPAMVGIFVMALYNLVDMFYISLVEGVDAVAGLTVSFPVMMIVMTLAAAVGVGTASVIARRLGEKRVDESNKIFGTFIFLILLISVVSILVGIFLLDNLLILFGATENIIGYASAYMLPILLGFIFVSFSMATNIVIRAEGNAKFAMYATIIPAIINIIIDPILIFDFGFGLGVMGAGIATVISQGIMSIIILIYYHKGYSSLTIYLHNIKIRISTIKEIVAIGFPTFMHTASFSIIAIVINTMLLQYGGDMYLAAYGVAQRVIAFAIMPINGIMQGMLPIVGFNYGAELYERMRKTIWLSFKYVVIISVVVVLLVQLFPEYAMSIFTSDPEFIEIGSNAMKIIFSLYFVVGVQIIAGGIYQALGKPRQALILSLSRQVFFLVPLVIILPIYFGVYGVFIAFPIADLLTFILASFMLYRDKDTILVKGKNE